MKRPITISADLAYEICDLLAAFSGFAIGVSGALPSMKPQTNPLVDRADRVADRLRPLLAESLAEEKLKELRR